MSRQVSLTRLNTADRDEFVRLLADVFEHSPWIPLRAWQNRPFDSIPDLHAKMVAVVDAASASERLELLRAHPELAGKEARDGALTESSTSEQKSAGLNALSRDELQRVKSLNADYREKFGFPFIIAVLDNTREDIFRKWQQRLANDRDTEIGAGLEQVYLIAKLRLDALIAE